MKRSGYAVLAVVTLTMALPMIASGSPAVSEMKTGEHDLTGMWRIDAAKSDAPQYVYGAPIVAPGGEVSLLPHVFRIGRVDRDLIRNVTERTPQIREQSLDVGATL